MVEWYISRDLLIVPGPVFEITHFSQIIWESKEKSIIANWTKSLAADAPVSVRRRSNLQDNLNAVALAYGMHVNG